MMTLRGRCAAAVPRGPCRHGGVDDAPWCASTPCDQRRLDTLVSHLLHADTRGGKSVFLHPPQMSESFCPDAQNHVRRVEGIRKTCLSPPKIIHVQPPKTQLQILRLLRRTRIDEPFADACRFIAAQNGHAEVAHLLIREAGVDVEAVRDGGFTALFVAAQHGTPPPSQKKKRRSRARRILVLAGDHQI